MQEFFLTIIVPAFNEEEHLKTSVDEVRKALEQIEINFEIIIVDDCSTDNTFSIAQNLSQRNPHVKVLQNPKNLGLGGTYRTGLSVASGTHVTWVPADESHPARGLLPTYKAIGTADIIIPRVTNPEIRGRRRRLISRCYTTLVNFLSGLHMPYYNGLSVHRVDLLKNISLQSNGFGFQAEAIVKLIYQKASFITTDATIYERPSGESKAFTLRNIMSVASVLLYILWLRMRRN
ncbi:MAG: glycosyltransferase family 2 protein [Pseudomonadota bacterium]|nr:glycosyltransferase family 2 protein [Pseudomonadota bacterium]